MSLTTNVTSAGGAVTVAFTGELDISRADEVENGDARES